MYKIEKKQESNSYKIGLRDKIDKTGIKQEKKLEKIGYKYI